MATILGAFLLGLALPEAASALAEATPDPAVARAASEPGMAVPRGDAQLVNFLENAMGALEASGVMNGVRVRWLERSDWVAQLP